ncbi:MAG: ABC transporter permease, partial [Lachnospiraceae bacterium]|nr:ABC transporter permease [Lachnospiraceae bacterium]
GCLVRKYRIRGTITAEYSPDSEITEYIGENGIVYSYNTSFDVYAMDENGNYLNTSRNLDEDDSSSNSMLSMMSGNMSAISSGNTSSISTPFSLLSGTSGSFSGADNFEEMLAGTGDSLVSTVVTDSYSVLYGSWPENYNEVVLVLDENNSIDTATLYQLGLISEDQYDAIVDAIEEGGDDIEEITLDYSGIVGTTFQLVTFSDYYTENEDGTFEDASGSYAMLNEIIDNGLELTITGIVRANEDPSVAISTAVGYTAALTDYIIDHTNSSAVILAQEADPETDVLTGRTFAEPDDETKAAEAAEYISGLGVSDKASIYTMILYMDQYAATGSLTDSGTDLSGLTDSGTDLSSTGSLTDSGTDLSSAGTDSLDESTLAAMMDAWLADDPDEETLITVYDTYLTGGSYEDNMESFGKVSYDAPSSISIYCDTFDDKDDVAECITDYNRTVSEDEQITYTDYVAMMTSAITSMVDMISYVLIAFVAISLVVSCIMISIITQISVIERTKEIGILRAIGASRRNISQVFNAETFIIGISSGLIGIGLSELLIIPINAVIHMITGSDNVNAVLPWNYALILVAISIIITVFSGLAPAHSAAKKDPVVALRTE